MKQVLFALSVLCYPLFVYFGLQYLEPQYIAIAFAALFLMRHFSKGKTAKTIPHLNLVAVVITLLLLFSAIANSEVALKFYPVVMSLSFLLIFGYSLVKPPAVVTVIASLHEELDQRGIDYTRQVTKVWCGFFVANALIALWSIFTPDPRVWLIYNGLVSYILMGCLMAGEWLIRQRVKRKNNDLS